MVIIIYGGAIMFEIEDLIKDIEILRAKLLFLIGKKQGNLLDEEIVNTNKILSEALSQYNRALG